MNDRRVKVPNDKKIAVILEFLPKILAEMQERRDDMGELVFLANRAKAACSTLEIAAQKENHREMVQFSDSELKDTFDDFGKWDYKTYYPEEGEDKNEG